MRVKAIMQHAFYQVLVFAGIVSTYIAINGLFTVFFPDEEKMVIDIVPFLVFLTLGILLFGLGIRGLCTYKQRRGQAS